MDTQVDVFVVSIKLDAGIVEVKALSFGTGRNTPARYVGADLAPDALGKGSNVRRGAGMGGPRGMGSARGGGRGGYSQRPGSGGQ